MRVRIYTKGKPEQATSYEFDLQEFQRLSSDYEEYLKVGTPRKGIYTIYTDAEHQQTKKLFLDFDYISAIV